MAIVILTAGAVTDSRARTVDARAWIPCLAVVFVLLMCGCFALGYGMAPETPAKQASETTSTQLDLERPETRALIDRVGSLAGRLARLEGQAAALRKRLEDKPVETPPAGGPFVPVAALAAPTTVQTLLAGNFDLGLAHLELATERLETTVARLTDGAIAEGRSSMAFPSRAPTPGSRTSSGFGIRRDPLTGRLARHQGLDFAAPKGAPIYASAGGRVVSAGYKGPYGYAVLIDHGNGLSTLYGHASRLYVRTGDVVLPQQKIAAVGSTGRSTGPHLHFEVRRNGIQVEPRAFLGRNAETVAAR